MTDNYPSFGGGSSSQAGAIRKEHLSALLDHSPSLVFLKDEDGRYVYLNKAYEDSFVHSADWLGKTDFDFWPKDSAELFRANDAEVLQSNQVHQFTEDSFDLEGKRHVWVNYKFPLTDSEGHRYTGGIGIDATRMVEAEEALHESEAKYRELFDSMDQAYCVIEVLFDEWMNPVDYRFLETNRVFEQQTGLVDAKGQLMRTLAPEHEQHWFDIYGRIALTGRPERFENPAAALGRYYDVYAYRVGDPEEHKVAILFWDITDRRRIEDELRRSEEEARQLIRYAPTGIYQIDFRTHRFTSVNEAMAVLSGYSQEELLAMDPMEILTPDSQRLFADRLQKMLAGAQPSNEVEYQVRKKDGSEIFVVLNVSFELDDNGIPAKALVIGHDVTERRRQEEEKARLLEAQKVRRRRVEALHDVMKVGLAAVDVHSAAQRILEHLSGHYDFDLSSIWMAADDNLERVAQVGYPADWPSSLPLSGPYDATRAFNAGSTLLVREPTNEAVLEAYRDKCVPLDSYMVLPLKARGHTVGTLNLVWTREREIDGYDVEFFESVADEVAVVLENTRLYEVEHRIAETLQETLVVLPRLVPGVEFARAYESATYQAGWVGGDFVDLFPIDPHHVGVVIGDVSGKGTEAAVTTSLVRNTLRAFALEGFSPSEICDKTNTVIHRFTETEAFVTLFFGILDTLSGSLRYSVAGHPPAMILTENGKVRELPVSGNAMIGAFEQIVCSEQEATLLRGERLLLYTDGVVEARLRGSQELYGESRLQASVEAHAASPTGRLPQALMDKVIEFSEGVLRDDAAILVVELAAESGT